jgi:hypothetical protein
MKIYLSSPVILPVYFFFCASFSSFLHVVPFLPFLSGILFVYFRLFGLIFIFIFYLPFNFFLVLTIYSSTCSVIIVFFGFSFSVPYFFTWFSELYIFLFFLCPSFCLIFSSHLNSALVFCLSVISLYLKVL